MDLVDKAMNFPWHGTVAFRKGWGDAVSVQRPMVTSVPIPVCSSEHIRKRL